MINIYDNYNSYLYLCLCILLYSMPCIISLLKSFNSTFTKQFSYILIQTTYNHIVLHLVHGSNLLLVFGLFH